MPVSPGIFIALQIVTMSCSLVKWGVILGVAISLARSARIFVRGG